MTDLGVKSPNVSVASLLDDVLGNRAGSSRRLKIVDLAKQLAGTSPINLLGNQAPLYATYADLVAATIATKVSAWVYEDPDPDKNGIYGWISNTWTWVLPLPYSFIDATDTGAGTANAIKATSEIPVSEAALISVEIFRNTTDVPVTISFNDGPALTLKTITNSAQLALTGGMLVWGKIYGSDFRLTVDQDVSALVAQVEVKAAAAAASAQEAHNSETAAANYAASINPASFVPKTWVTRNVLQHGAYSDGTNAAATSTAFQAAYNAASEGDTIVVPPGSYDFTAGVEVDANKKSVNWLIYGDLLLPSYNWINILPGNAMQFGRQTPKNGVPDVIAWRSDFKGMGVETTNSVDYDSIDIQDDIKTSPGRVQGRVVYMRVRGGAYGIRQADVGQVLIEETPGLTPGGGYWVGIQGYSGAFAASVHDDSLHGSNFYAETTNGATGYYNITGSESNVLIHTGSSARYRSGFQAAGGGNLHGTETDAAFYASTLAGATVRWKLGLAFGNANGDYALGTTSTAIDINEQTIYRGLDLHNTTVTDAIISEVNNRMETASLQLTAPSHSLLLGNRANVNTPKMYFCSSGNTTPDVTINFSGGTSTVNQGTMAISATDVAFGCTPRPSADNARPLGGGSYRWSVVYSATGTINTSDRRAKLDITDIDPALARKLLKAIKPVTFRWKNDDTPAKTETRVVLRQKMEIIVDTREVEKINLVDGKAVLSIVTETYEREEPVFEEHLLFDEAGAPVMSKVRVEVGKRQKVILVKQGDGSRMEQPILDANGDPVMEPIYDLQETQRVYREPVWEEVEEIIEISPAHSKTNVRTHWGFIAQQVEAALAEVGLTTNDFAGFVYDSESDTYGLRTEQFIPIMWAAMREEV
ncbi:tail fiber domain-containing protein [Agrobacterium vitis]|uniref:tail fiber domain-containing protein n=1 Tax=Agrobacterium vitis TaxID=373 RepID=UPI0015761F61|nr:tail fiber domain-containing protein [Agrobacterium vitis]